MVFTRLTFSLETYCSRPGISNSYDEAALCQVEKPDEHYRIERIDGKKDRWAPEYLWTAEPLTNFTSTDENLKVKLADMGGGK